MTRRSSLLSTSIFLVSLGIFSIAAQRGSVSRLELSAMEKTFDDKLKRFNIDAPIELLGLTRGVYLEGYGAMFTAELNLITAPGISPFRPTITKEEIARVRQTKLQRVPAIKQMMRDMMIASAQSLDRVPDGEQIGLAVLLLNRPWEDKTGLPQQILMQAKRRALLDVATNRADKSTLDTAIRERVE